MLFADTGEGMKSNNLLISLIKVLDWRNLEDSRLDGC